MGTKRSLIIALVSVIVAVLGGLGAWYALNHPSAGEVEVLAEEVYPEFYCYCGCGGGMPIDGCGCAHAAEMRGYIDGLIAGGLPRLEVLLKVAGRWGQENVIREETREQIRAELVARAPKERPQIAVEPERYDLGRVSIAAGVVSRSFELRNEGKADLVIEGISTSCGCTTAQLVVGGVESPIFGMHENPEWSGVLAPGESGELRVFFDPAHHGPEGTGPFTRFVLIESNDPINGRIKVKLEGEVTK
jgi:hypothetical protein